MVPKTRLTEISLESLRGSVEIAIYHWLVSDINRGRRQADYVLNGIFIMSKYMPDYCDLYHLKNCIIDGIKISFLDCLKRKKFPELAEIDGQFIPIRGLIELLATARLLGDTDVLGVSGKNAGFVVERDMYHRALCVRIVKIDPGFAFDFSEANPFHSGVNQLDLDPLKRDGRNIQYAVNSGCLLPWENLSEVQQRLYLQTFHRVFQQLRQREFLDLVLAQEGFKASPSGKVLRFVETFTQNIMTSLNGYLNAQERIFAKELKPYSHAPSRDSFEQLASQYGLYAQRPQTMQGIHPFASMGAKMG